MAKNMCVSPTWTSFSCRIRFRDIRALKMNIEDFGADLCRCKSGTYSSQIRQRNNCGGDARPLKIWSEFSSLQYINSNFKNFMKNGVTWSVWLFVNKNVMQTILLFAFVYIKTCTLSFADGSHCYFHLYTKSFFCETFLYIRSASIVRGTMVFQWKKLWMENTTAPNGKYDCASNYMTLSCRLQ